MYALHIVMYLSERQPARHAYGNITIVYLKSNDATYRNASFKISFKIHCEFPQIAPVGNTYFLA